MVTRSSGEGSALSDPSAVRRLGSRAPLPGTRARPDADTWSLRAAVGGVAAGFGPLVAELHPVIRPSGASPVALNNVSLNMNRAGSGPAPCPWSIRNDDESLKTIPVGNEAVTSMGTFTTRSCALVAPL